jgi:hypothetical protein
MEKIASFIKSQPSYRLFIAGVILFSLTYFGPQYIGIIPGVIGMAVWVVLLGRAVGKSIDAKRPGTTRPWWTSL